MFVLWGKCSSPWTESLIWSFQLPVLCSASSRMTWQVERVVVYCFPILFIGLCCYQDFLHQFCGSDYLMNGTEQLQEVTIFQSMSRWRVILRTLECIYRSPEIRCLTLVLGWHCRLPESYQVLLQPLLVPHHRMKFHHRTFGFLLPVTRDVQHHQKSKE